MKHFFAFSAFTFLITTSAFTQTKKDLDKEAIKDMC